MKIRALLVLILPILLNACASYDSYYQLDEQYLQRRQLSTKRFEVKDEESILISSAQLLQDLGFTLDESETKLGLITAYKDRDAGSITLKAGMVLLAALSGTQPVYDVNQKIYVTLVSTKSRTHTGYNIRAEFARIIWNNMNQARIEKISDPLIYKDFFDKLSQSAFLTANDI